MVHSHSLILSSHSQKLQLVNIGEYWRIHSAGTCKSGTCNAPLRSYTIFYILDRCQGPNTQSGKKSSCTCTWQLALGASPLCSWIPVLLACVEIETETTMYCVLQQLQQLDVHQLLDQTLCNESFDDPSLTISILSL